MIWYVRRGEREIGPLGEDALRALVGTGQVTHDTPLWHEGLPGWTAAGALPGVLGPKAAGAAPGTQPATPRARIRPHHWATAGILLVAIAALLALRPQAQHDRARHTFPRRPTSALQQELTQAANGVNASTPRMIDDMTRLDGAQAGPGTLFTYDYTLTNISASRLSPPSLQTLRQRLSADVRHTVCEGAALQPLLQMGAVIRFHYRDRDGQDLVLTSVSSAACTR
ncbi:MAG TPA: DUF4339 domain-containing protein [Steroidobacteraceae bacterium]|jgi:hypothetical protein|nr:DUF4339 domain-containing protein [Steroidobacteraceae bacterium]